MSAFFKYEKRTVSLFCSSSTKDFWFYESAKCHTTEIDIKSLLFCTHANIPSVWWWGTKRLSRTLLPLDVTHMNSILHTSSIWIKWERFSAICSDSVAPYSFLQMTAIYPVSAKGLHKFSWAMRWADEADPSLLRDDKVNGSSRNRTRPKTKRKGLAILFS